MTRNRSVIPSEKDDAVAAVDLQAARESLGLTFEDIFQQSRISVNTLQAIETRNFRSLPPPVYTRTFIRQYAKILGVDEKNLLVHYEKYLDTLNAPPPPVQGSNKPWKLTHIHYKTFVSLASLLLIGFVILLLSLCHRSDVDIPHNPLPPQKPAVVVPEMPPLPAPSFPKNINAGVSGKEQGNSAPSNGLSSLSPENKSRTEPTPPSNGKISTSRPAVPGSPYRITIEARELTWLQIRSDLDPPYKVMLKPGGKLERHARVSLALDIGNAGGVDVRFQDKSLGNLGKPGEVVHIKLP